MTYHAKVIAGGKIVLPAEFRREFGIQDGDSLVIERDPQGGLRVLTYAQVVREVQEEFRAMLPSDYSGSLVDDLIADRRAAAEREDADFDTVR